MRERAHEQNVSAGALSESQLNQKIKRVRKSIGIIDNELGRLNKHSRRNARKIPELSKRQFKSRRGILKHRRRKLEKLLENLQRQKEALRLQRQS